jgi:radical SAM protein with 4Fe4S-binding SPASM domain
MSELVPLMTEDYACTLPEVYYLDTGNICNLRCPFCPTGLLQKSLNRGLMSRDTFDVVFEQIKPHAKTVNLFNWGEPFINENVLYMASACAEHGIRSQIDSNLTLREISDEESDAIVHSGLSRIAASIDGASQQTYERYRVGGNLERALRNLRQLASAKKRAASVTPDISWSFLINKYNEHEIEKAKTMARDIAVPIEFKLMSCWDHSWNSSLHEQPPPGLQEPVAQQDFRPLPLKLSDLTLHGGLHSWCSQPFDIMVINWDGRVMPCCTVYSDEFAIGNLLEDGINEVWNNNKYRDCRKFLYNYGPIQNTGSVCETLPCPLSRKFLDAPVDARAELNIKP